MDKLWKYLGGDKAIWMVVLVMALASVLLVYSSVVAIAYKFKGGNTLYYVVKHAIFICSGFGFIYVLHRINYKYFGIIAKFLLWVAVPLLLLTLVMGVNINNASRWLVIPVINQSFQTSDMAKLALIMFLARGLHVRRNNLGSFSQTFLPLMAPVAIICGLILPANFSTAAVLFVCSIMLMFMAGVPIKHLLSLIPAALLAGFLVFSISKVAPDAFPRLDTWVSRVENYASGEVDPDGDYQSQQAKIAIATGGVFGKGPGNSTQRSFLPQSESDFIFAIVLEEYGFFGGMAILMLYLILLFRSIKIVQKVQLNFGAYLVLGLSFSLVFQGLINMGVNVGLLPVTGQPLPLVSMGGTSLWFTCIALGMILSVSRSLEKQADGEKEKGGNRVVV